MRTQTPDNSPILDGREGPEAGTGEGRRGGPVPAWLGRLAEPLYRAAISRRNRRFDAGAGVERLGVPVISIGNLSVGGTGKTPMVMHVLRLLYEAGVRPCVAMRGYTRRTARGRPVPAARPRLLIEQAANELHPPENFSDEADEYRRAFPEMPMVVRPDRIMGLRELLEKPFQPRVDCVVLDDGFQHRQIARDLDIVLLDASHPPMSDHLLPRGYLREPPESLRRASCVIVTHAELCGPGGMGEAARELGDGAACGSFLELTSFITRHHGRPPIAITSHIWTGLKRARSHRLEEDERLPLDHLLGRRVVAACAIGNPRGFLSALERALTSDRSRRGDLLARHVLPDHDPFEESTARAIAESARIVDADAIVVTDKDWSKLRRFPAGFWPCPVIRPELSLVFDTGGAAVAELVLNTARRTDGGVTPGA